MHTEKIAGVHPCARVQLDLKFRDLESKSHRPILAKINVPDMYEEK